MLQVDLDPHALRLMWAQLNQRDRLKVLRNPTRRAANKVRRAAMTALKGRAIHNAAAIAKTIRVNVFKQKLGFKVRVLTKFRKSMHTNRKGQERPLAYWFEGGTRQRHTKKGAGRGQLTKLGFMSAAAAANQSAVVDIMEGMVEWLEKLSSK